MSPDRDGAWDLAPCGLLTLREDGTVVEANATFLEWVGRGEAEVAGRLRLSELLSVGGRIYWETHLSPMLFVDGRIDEVALELRAPQGRLPVLVTAVVGPAAEGEPVSVRVALSSARERSRYERELLAARKEADRSAAQTRVLQRVTSALSSAVGVDGVMGALLAQATGTLGAASATFWLAEPREGLVPRAASGEPLGVAPRPAAGPRARAAVADGGRVLVPLQGQSSLRGVLSIAPRDDPMADPLDLQVLTAVGEQGGLALDRAQLYEQSASVAHQLQQSLLAVEVPQDGRFVVTTAYRPGVEVLEVGGDWYDAFLVERDVLAVVVGDVVGRGLGAAAAMGQLRSAVRAVAGPEIGPAGVLSRLDRFVGQVDAAASATLAYAEVNLATGRIRHASAGHMPPLLLPAGGGARLVWDGRSTPLGLVRPGVERAEADLHLRPGDRLLLFTDGLVERRRRSLREGLEILKGVAADVHGAPPAEAVDVLVRRLLEDEQGHDDVCVLLLSWLGPS
ncbi:SpoIIE family protein phosphatase [Georgenia sp. SYP-B2076]|uniref:SpoIIE family protein phosphatase n=1 Tax=Georgenia sp. SYP-B2076 TaxID=2495881 RepID=UPI000F8D7279|nr:SpoIIE family protein phosphatase [Georgenia sp. SYP-B2076]